VTTMSDLQTGHGCRDRLGATNCFALTRCCIQLVWLIGVVLVSHPAYALSSGQVSVTMTTDSALVSDSNACSTGVGPRAVYVGFRVTNISGGTLNNLSVTLGGFTTGFALNNGQVASQVIGSLANNASDVLYWHISYPCHTASPNSNQLSLTIADANSGTVTINSGTTVTSTSSISASAGGLISSATLGAGAVLGQIITYDVQYSFGNVQNGDRFNMQPSGNTSYDAKCFQLVNSKVTASAVTAIPVNTTDQLLFVASGSQGGSGNLVTIRYFIKYQCAGATTTSSPYASQTGKYSGNFGAAATQVSFPTSTNSLNISKTASVSTIAAGGTVTYTVTISNSSTLYDSYVDRITDVLPTGVTYTGLATGSDVTAANSQGVPSSGATGTINFYGIPSSSYLVPKNSSLVLKYTVTAPTTVGTSANSATAVSGTTTIGPAAASVQVVGLAGYVFEDVNYGGGSGRSMASSSGVGRPNVRVELYDSSGTYVTATTTDSTGLYQFGVAAGTYSVRVVNSWVTSSRTGACAQGNLNTPPASCTQLSVQTFRTNSLTSNVGTPDPNRVGGERPSVADTGAGGTGAVLNSSGVFTTAGGSATLNGQAQSISTLTVGTANVSGVNFGYNFDTTVNTNDSGQGSLRQFITNSNALSNAAPSTLAQVGSTTNTRGTTSALTSGKETSIFMIPDGTARNGLRSGLTSQLTSGVAVIQLSSILPMISDSDTIIDGGTQTYNNTNTNTTTLNTATTVGIDGLTVPAIQGPEVQLQPSSTFYSIATSGLIIGATNTTVQNMSVLGFSASITTTDEANIYVNSGATGAMIRWNVIGTTAKSYTDPGVLSRTTDYGVVSKEGSLTVRENLVAFSGAGGVELYNGSSSTLIEANELKNNAVTNTFAGNLNINTGGSVMVKGNLSVNAGGAGFDTSSSTGSNTFENNTVTGNGILTTGRTSGIRVQGSNNIIRKNIIGQNHGAGILVRYAIANTGNLITQNSIFGNGTTGTTPSKQLGIDLVATVLESGDTGSSPYTTVNDANDADTGPNTLINFPIFESITISSSNLLLTGCAPSGTTIELFEADVSPGKSSSSGANTNSPRTLDYGEGETYLTTLTEGSSDTDSGTGCTATDGNDQTGMARFAFAVSTPTGVGFGDKLTATATLSNNTSEFSPVLSVTGTDYGDAPSSLTSIDASLATTYQTASQLIGTTYLGSSIDGETANQPNATATGDDTTYTDDEDGVSFPSPALISGQSNTMTVTVSASGYLNTWIDWNQDGDFADAGEQIATNQALSAGSNSLSVTPSTSYPHGATYARFRFTSSSVASPSPTGTSTLIGEVEDYQVSIALPTPPPGSCNVGLLDDGFELPNITGSSPTPFNTFSPLIKAYKEADVEGWGTIANDATSGSSFDQRNVIELWRETSPPAYEGSQYAEINAYVAGTLYQDVITTPGTVLTWQFAHRGRSGTDTVEVVIGAPGSLVSQGQFSTSNTAWKVYRGSYTVPTGQTITRFGFKAVSSTGGTSYGNFIDDVRFGVNCDYSDAPSSYGNANHVLDSRYLGSTLDADDGAWHNGTDNNSNASDDDTNDNTVISGSSNDDEDGVRLNSADLQGQTLTSGTTATLSITTVGSGVLNAWIDWNRDGDFSDTGEQIATDTSPASNLITLNVSVPSAVVAGTSYARFRFGPSGTASTGGVTGGEVEDYQLSLLPAADVVIRKTGTSSVNPNDAVSYTLKVWNNGLVAVTGVHVTDTMPASLTGVTWTCTATGTADCDTAASGTGASSSGNIALSNVSLNVDTGAMTTADTNYLTITVSATAPAVITTFTNTGAITVPSSVNDPDSSNNSSSVTTTMPLVQDVNLAISKEVDINGPEVGDTILYTITVTNTSTTNATNVVVTDTFPSSLSFVKTTGCAEDPNGLTSSTLVCALGSLGSGSSKSFTLESLVRDEGDSGDSDDIGKIITNSVSVTATENDSDTSNNTSSVDIVVSKLQLVKEVRNVTTGGSFGNTVTAKPGDLLEYRITYARMGSAIFDLVIRDNIPANTILAENIYDTTVDKEVTVRCTDGTEVFLNTDAVTTVAVDLASNCSLNIANDSGGNSREALLSGESGYILFSVRIQ
jgi:uncharacterized repeat protein (TIGR01451 family)